MVRETLLKHALGNQILEATQRYQKRSLTFLHLSIAVESFQVIVILLYDSRYQSAFLGLTAFFGILAVESLLRRKEQDRPLPKGDRRTTLILIIVVTLVLLTWLRLTDLAPDQKTGLIIIILVGFCYSSFKELKPKQIRHERQVILLLAISLYGMLTQVLEVLGISIISLLYHLEEIIP